MCIRDRPIKYEGSQVLKMTVNFKIDRYAAGKFSSYDKYRTRHNNIKDNVDSAEEKEANSFVYQQEDIFGAQAFNDVSFNTSIFYGQDSIDGSVYPS